MGTELASKSCEPCHAGTPAVPDDEAQRMLAQLPGWKIEGGNLHRRFKFKDFVGAVAFTVEVGEIAEAEGHHPDLCLGWGYVTADLHTHAINALSQNDFILAAKISEVAERHIGPPPTELPEG